MLNNNTPTRLGKQEIACEKNKAQIKCNSLICTGLSQMCGYKKSQSSNEIIKMLFSKCRKSLTIIDTKFILKV